LGAAQVLVAISRLRDSYTKWEFSCIAIAVADPKPSLVERLFAEHGGGLQSFFRRRIRSKVDAADLAQEVYIRMLRIRDQEGIRNPVHYLYTVANNLVKEHAALEHRQAMSIDIEEAPAQEQLETLPVFDGELDARRRAERLGVVLNQLRPNCRTAYLPVRKLVREAQHQMTDTRAQLYANYAQWYKAVTVSRPRTIGLRFSYKFSGK